MGAILVVIRHPLVNSILYLGEGVEQIGIKQFLPKTLVESFNQGVLIGFTMTYPHK